MSRGYFIRTEQWRYLWFVDRSREELYRIQEDPGETRNVVSEHPDLARRYRTDIEEWKRNMGLPYGQ